MLLDFHLARGPLDSGAAAPAWLGGTPGYMPPEQQAALQAVAQNRPLLVALDGRADVYALGRLLCELLAGQLPSAEDDAIRSTRRSNPAVTGGLAALLGRCLAPAPAERYGSAADLAADLRRHLADRPLRGVRNSLRERWLRWRRRSWTFLLLLLALLGLATGGGLLACLRLRSPKAQGALGVRREQRMGRETDRALAAGELHRFCETIRPLYGAAGLPLAQARRVVAQCRRMWEKRDHIRACLDEQSDSALGRQVGADLLDLAILFAHLRVRLEDGKTPQARGEALSILAQAEALLGPRSVLDRERAALARATEIPQRER
jgi:hypothetical protein